MEPKRTGLFDLNWEKNWPPARDDATEIFTGPSALVLGNVKSVPPGTHNGQAELGQETGSNEHLSDGDCLETNMKFKEVSPTIFQHIFSRIIRTDVFDDCSETNRLDKKPEPRYPDVCSQDIKRNMTSPESCNLNIADLIPIIAEGYTCVKKEVEDPLKVKLIRKDNRKPKPRECPVCGQWCSNKNSFWRHKQIHLADKAYRCEFCPMAFPRAESLLSHRFTHTGVYPFRCDICCKGMRSMWAKVTHMRLHVGEKPHVCEICAKDFTTKSDLTKHLMSHLKIKRHRCEICGKYFSQSKNLTFHKSVHSDARNFLCHVCNKAFKTKPQLSRHIVVVHEKKSGTYYCPHCPKTYDSERNVRQHISRHEMKKNQECEICMKKYRFLSELKRHRLQAHTLFGPLMCTHCGKYFKRKARLNKHIQAVHFAVKKSCDICGQKYHRQGDLDNHIKVHSNNLLSCVVCGKKYLRMSSLRTHMLLHE